MVFSVYEDNEILFGMFIFILKNNFLFLYAFDIASPLWQAVPFVVISSLFCLCFVLKFLCRMWWWSKLLSEEESKEQVEQEGETRMLFFVIHIHPCTKKCLFFFCFCLCVCCFKNIRLWSVLKAVEAGEAKFWWCIRNICWIIWWFIVSLYYYEFLMVYLVVLMDIQEICHAKHVCVLQEE